MFLSGLLNRVTGQRARFFARVQDAVKMTRRGGVRHDALILNNMSLRLEVMWRARDVHPWDRDLPAQRRHALFVEQCTDDTLTAIKQLFDQIAEVDVVDIRVLAPEPSPAVLLSATVSRDEVDNLVAQRSPRMSLK